VQQPATVDLPTELVEPRRARAVEWLRRSGRRGALIATLGLLLLAGLVARSRETSSQDEAPSNGNGGAVAAVAETKGTNVASGWDDQVTEHLNDLAADVDQLQSDCLDEVQHDSLTARIEQLKRDVDELEARTTKSLP
jgi:hypothetical protein